MTGINRKKRLLLIIGFFIFFILPLTVNPIASMPTCAYGSFDAWLSIDGYNWMNTTVKNLSLECGQPFYVKTVLRSNTEDIWLAIYLFEPGVTTSADESFIVLEGPCQLNNYADLGKTKANESIQMIWKMQVKNDPIWSGGKTPLSISGFFQKYQNGKWITEDITFSIANIHLQQTSWNEYSQFDLINMDSKPLDSKGFFFFSIPLILFLLLSWQLKKRRS